MCPIGNKNALHYSASILSLMLSGSWWPDEVKCEGEGGRDWQQIHY